MCSVIVLLEEKGWQGRDDRLEALGQRAKGIRQMGSRICSSIQERVAGTPGPVVFSPEPAKERGFWQ